MRAPPRDVYKRQLPATATAVNGTTPGLYGGTGSESCDAAQLKAFLGSNPDKAAAWVGALNADSNLRWGNGQKLTVAEIPVFIDNLVPTVLQQDTWVTNHGFADGTATPFQSVLPRGTSVFVDRYGVPRARCLCGNPLLPPKLSNVPPGSQTTPPPAESTPPPSNEKPCIPVAVSYTHLDVYKRQSLRCAPSSTVNRSCRFSVCPPGALSGRPTSSCSSCGSTRVLLVSRQPWRACASGLRGSHERDSAVVSGQVAGALRARAPG